MTTITALLTARPELTRTRYAALLRFERGPTRVIPLDTHQLGPWYTPAVTETLASQIRALAAERRYDKLDADAQRALRREIADELGTKIQNVVKALKQAEGQGHGGGRARTIPAEHRCPCCEQLYQTQRARDSAERFLAKLPKRRK